MIKKIKKTQIKKIDATDSLVLSGLNSIDFRINPSLDGSRIGAVPI